MEMRGARTSIDFDLLADTTFDKDQKSHQENRE